jgi:hypothetical protein
MGGACSKHVRNTKSWSEILKGRDHLENAGVDERTILKWILWKQGGCGLDSSSSGKGSVLGSCEHSTEPSGCMKIKFLD